MNTLMQLVRQDYLGYYKMCIEGNPEGWMWLCLHDCVKRRHKKRQYGGLAFKDTPASGKLEQRPASL